MDPRTGGVAQTLRNLVPVLVRKGISTEILCFDGQSPEPSSDESCIIHRIGPSAGRWGRVNGFRRWLDMHAHAFDVITLHGLWLYNGYAYTKWLRDQRAVPGFSLPRTWIMPHGMLDPWFQRSSGRRLKSIRNLIYWWLIERRTIASAAQLIFTTAAERDKARTTFPFYRPRRTAILPLGVPEPPAAEWIQTSSGTSSATREDRFILAIGRIDPKKGFNLLPEVWVNLSKDARYKDHLPDLLIAGPGWETRYGIGLKKRIEAAGLGDRIRISEMLQGQAKWNALRSSEAVIMPSHQENFGLVAAEALACGTPVLLSDRVDIHRSISDGNAGFSDHDTVQGVERMIKRWLDLSAEARMVMKYSARKTYEDRFSIENTTSRFIGLLEER